MQTSGPSYNNMQGYKRHVRCPQLKSDRKGEGREQGGKEDEGEQLEKIEKRGQNSKLNRGVESVRR